MPALGFTPVPTTSSEPLPAFEERKKVDEITAQVEASIKEGDFFYLLSSRWWREWSSYVGNEEVHDGKEVTEKGGNTTLVQASRRPPPIDNGELLVGLPTGDVTAEPELKELLAEERDYILVPAAVWIVFQQWYGGGPAIKRSVIRVRQQDQPVVEVYPLRLRVYRWDRNEETVVFMSKKATVRKLMERVSKLFGLQTTDVRIWDFFGGKRDKILSDPDQVLQDTMLQMNNELLVEEKGKNGWLSEAAEDSVHKVDPYANNNALAILPTTSGEAQGQSIARGALPSKGGGGTGGGSSSSWVPFPTWSPFSSSTTAKDTDNGWMGGSSASAKEGPYGLMGLTNLGNTCFMNSALQCLVHTPPLKDFFMGDYSSQINSSNALGMQGELALSFADLLRKLWASGKQPIPPRQFKTKLAKFAPQFSGYNQHDSQELLAFLLDGLHEDLNRVHRKPYIEAKDANGRPDDVVADEYWANHKARNDSIIVDTCQGQYKSTLVCPVCSKVSVTFDPFMYLSLPLPAKSTRAMTMTVISCDGARGPEIHTINVPKLGKFKDLHHLLGKACNILANEKLIFAEVYNSRIFRFFMQENESLSTVNDADRLIAYRVEANSGPRVVLVQRKPEKHTSDPWKQISTPLMVCAPSSGLESSTELYKLVEKALLPFHMPDRQWGEATNELLPREGSAVLDSRQEIAGSVNGAQRPLGTNGVNVVEDQDSAMEDSDVSEGVEAYRSNDGGISRQKWPFSTTAEGEVEGEGVGEGVGEGEGGGDEGVGDQGESMDVEGHDDRLLAGTPRALTETYEPGNERDKVNASRQEYGDVVSQPPQGNGSYPFKLSWTRGKCEHIDEEVVLDEPIPATYFGVSGQSEPRQLVLDWLSEDTLASYDMRILEKLPATLKSSFHQPLKGKWQEAVSLYSCLEGFLKEEPLGPDDMWYCPSCKEHRQASKKLDLWRLPEILVVHLKRFSYSRYLKNKLDTLVHFPIHDLDFGRYARSDGEVHFYELYAVSNHYGGMGGGHYTAYCKVDDSGQWYSFDDSHVSPVSAGDILTSAAYVLFYQRKRPSAKEEASPPVDPPSHAHSQPQPQPL